MTKRIKAVCLALALFGAYTPFASAYEIERVEPPMWWLGFNDTELQLLVYGPNISELAPSVDYEGISISRVERVDSPNYLFVYLDIGAIVEPGTFDITFANDDAQVDYRYELLQKNPDPAHTKGFSPVDSIYLITPDRFANGDPDNDNVAGMGDEVDRSNLGGRHGGDIQGIADSLDYIVEMGFTAIWLNPLLENAMPTYSYHGYATTDFYKVDSRYGTNEDYRKLVADAKKKGIGVIMDMIVNHSGIEHWWLADLPTKDWINHQGQFAPTSHERTAWQDPYASQYDTDLFADGWFVETMPDLNQRNPLLADYLTQNALWWIEYLGLAGIRMDTYPYPDKDYMSEWTRRVMVEYPNFNIVGEEWTTNQPTIAYWQAGNKNKDGYVSYLPSLMDFPLQEALRSALTGEDKPNRSSLTKLYRTLANDFLYEDPNALVIFPDNHDMSRIFTQLGEDYDLYSMAMVYVLTMRGTPQIYYGTEILMANRESGDHGLIRSDFPGGWAGDKKNAFTGKGLTDREREAQQFMRRLLNWRKNKSVIHSGKLMQFAPFLGVYTYFRYNDDETVMVILNKTEEPVTLDMSRFAERLDNSSRGSDVITGKRYNIENSIALEARSVLILEIDEN